jgi:selT/selW/selH-like putative selenoprotein
LAARIKKETGVEPKLMEGDNGIFDVEVDGKLIYSKDQTGRFPEPEEVLKELKVLPA